MIKTDKALLDIVDRIGQSLIDKKKILVTAESCTGGWVGQVITSVSGTSKWYDRGFITYSNKAKREMLGVSTDLIARFGAASEQTARAMAEGALKSSGAHYSLSITGIAGPGGGSEEKPVGYVCFAWAGQGFDTTSTSSQFDGDRTQVRAQAVQHALEGLLKLVES